jgi:hypothetical protein
MSWAGEDTYVGQIPGFPAGTNVQYKIIAYDHARHFAVNNNAGQYYVYTVISEFPIWYSLILTLLGITTILILLLEQTKIPVKNGMRTSSFHRNLHFLDDDQTYSLRQKHGL